DRTGPGPAGPRLPGSTLVHPHLDVTRPPPYDELQVHPVRKGLLGRPRRLVAEVPGLAEIVDERHRVRITHVDVDRRPLVTVGLHDDSGRAGERGLTHVHRQRAVIVEYDLFDPGPRADPDRLVAGEPGFGQVPDEDADAVPAHLRDR